MPAVINHKNVLKMKPWKCKYIVAHELQAELINKSAWMHIHIRQNNAALQISTNKPDFQLLSSLSFIYIVSLINS